MRRTILGLAAALLPGTAAAQTAPDQPHPGEATQQIMPSSVFAPSPTQGLDASDDAFADGPIEQPFDAMGPMDAMPRIVLFDGADFSGRRMGLTADVADLTDQNFNAIASSVRIYGGTWQLCDQPNFAGHCETLTANADLETSSFGDKTASVRLVR